MSLRSMCLRRAALTAVSVLVGLAAGLSVPASALAQSKPKAPKGTGTDLEIDPDAPKPPPKDLPPSDPNAWGVGGKEDEGKFEPGADKKAKEKEKKEREAKAEAIDMGRPGEVGLDSVVGFGAMRDVVNDLQGPTKVTGGSLVLFFRYRVADIWSLSARFPFTRATITGPQQDPINDDYNSFSFGNLELKVSPAFAVTNNVRLVPALAFYIPTSTGDLFAPPNDQGLVAQALINQAAAYSRGWEDNPLFATKRLGLRLGFAVRFDTKEIHFEGGTKFDVMGKIGGNPARVTNDGITPVIHTPNIAWQLHASFAYDLFDAKLTPGLRAWFVYATAPVSEGTRNYSGPQFVIEPQVSTRWMLNAAKTLGVQGTIGFILPAGGHLGGGEPEAAIRGFRIQASFLF